MIKLKPTCFNLDEFANQSHVPNNSLYRQQINNPKLKKIILKYKKITASQNYIVAMFIGCDGNYLFFVSWRNL